MGYYNVDYIGLTKYRGKKIKAALCRYRLVVCWVVERSSLKE